MFHPSTNIRQIIASAANPEVDLRRLGRMVEQEPGLPERLIRYVNGFYTRFGGQLSSAMRALAVVGPRVVGDVAVQHALVSSLSQAGMPPHLSSLYWSDCLHRAISGRLLAETNKNLSADFAFTMGLALDFGTGVMLCRYPNQQLSWVRDVRPLIGQERVNAERIVFGSDRSDAFVSVARDWGLPEELVLIVEQYHLTDRSGVTRDNAPLFDIAVWANAMGESIASPSSSKDLRFWATGASNAFSVEISSASEIVIQVLKRTPAGAAAVGVPVVKQPTIKELRSRNSLGGVKEMGKHDLIQWAQILEEQNGILSHRVNDLQTTIEQQGARDSVTGLMSVQALLVQLKSEVRTARRRGQSLALLVVDLDGFTDLNAHYGYETGDMVLRKSGETLRKVLRGMDVVARVGADCFALLYAGDERAAKVLGERARAAIQAKQVDVGNHRIRLTATVAGMNLSDMPVTANAQQFLSAAQRTLNERGDLPDNSSIWAEKGEAKEG